MLVNFLIKAYSIFCRHSRTCIDRGAYPGMIKRNGHLFCGKQPPSNPKTSCWVKNKLFFPLFVLSEFLFISPCLIALPKSFDLLFYAYAAPLVDFQMERLCKINVLFYWVVLIWTMPISCIMPWLCRSLQGEGKIGCWQSQPVLWSNDPALMHSPITCTSLTDGEG